MNLALHDSTSKRPLVLLLVLVILAGAILRIYPSAHMKALGFDENYYRLYLSELIAVGVKNYPKITTAYTAAQSEMPNAVIPPTRFLFLTTAYALNRIFGIEPFVALRDTACIFASLTLVVTALFVARAASLEAALGVTALMACAPLQIQLAQRVYIDGFFTFWAMLSLWALWENLRAPNRYGWLLLYALSLALMVLTKENAAFIFIALCGIVLLNHWLKFGTVTPRLLAAMVVGPTLGAMTLILLCGGVRQCIELYLMNVHKSAELSYAIKTGDGPWHRYLIDLVIISPVVMLLAISGLFQEMKKLSLYLIVFMVISYVVMANIRYGMNLRYAAIWDLPLRWLAFAQLAALSVRVGKKYGTYFLVASVLLICALELRQYVIFFVDHAMYDPVTPAMLQSLDVLKP